MSGSEWFLPSPENAEATSARLRLFCFPFAGGGAAVYRPWRHKLPADIEVVPVCPPGREHRFGEAAYDTIDELVADLADVIRPMTTRPYTFFGYSMGGMIAHHLACRLMADGGRSPEHLFIAALRSPNITTPRRQLHLLPSDEFWAEVAAYGATPAEILENDQYRALFEPFLRADFKLAQTAHSADLPPLDCPITAFGGASDTNPAPAELDDWEQATTGPFEKHIYPGGHFFMKQHEESILALMTEKLSTPPVTDESAGYSRTSSN
ncbi:MAG: thioesterase II family protein [Pseudomonadota bacterium]